MRPVLRWCPLLAALVAIACGGSGPGDSVTGQTLPAGVWTWVDVPGTACNDGSQTGFAVNPGTQEDLVIYMEGGGACWDYQSCFVAQNASTGPVKAAQFEVRKLFFGGTYLDRSFAQNPFAGWTIVFVPYCTGDLHAGDNAATYSASGQASQVWQHRGRVNVGADLQRIKAAFPSVRRLVIGGSSAGGFGSLLQYDTIRAAFNAAEVSLLDDSGPPLEGDALAPALRTAWRSSWNLDPLLAQICTTCENDFSAIVPQLVGRYPFDRIALLSSMQDATMSRYFTLGASEFQAALTQTVHDRYGPTQYAKTFLIPGNAHGLLASPNATAGGVTLTTWLTQMLGRDPVWQSLGP